MWCCLPEEGRGQMGVEKLSLCPSVLSSCVSFGHPQGPDTFTGAATSLADMGVEPVGCF